jgi:hypothetical protein
MVVLVTTIFELEIVLIGTVECANQKPRRNH